MSGVIGQGVIYNCEGEKLCLQCGEYWPETSEFFFHTAGGGYASPCKACVDEERQRVASTLPCCVPGCEKPRYHWRRARCYEHRYTKVEGVKRGRKAVAMKYVINGSYYNWANHSRSRWFAEWAYWQRNKQLASGGGQRVTKRKNRKVK